MTTNIIIPKTRPVYTERYWSDKSQIPLHNKTNPTPVIKREIVCHILLLLYPLIQIAQNFNSCYNNINHKKKYLRESCLMGLWVTRIIVKLNFSNIVDCPSKTHSEISAVTLLGTMNDVRNEIIA